jgi:hypothetical protein
MMSPTMPTVRSVQLMDWSWLSKSRPNRSNARRNKGVTRYPIPAIRMIRKPRSAIFAEKFPQGQ